MGNAAAIVAAAGFPEMGMASGPVGIVVGNYPCPVRPAVAAAENVEHEATSFAQSFESKVAWATASDLLATEAAAGPEPVAKQAAVAGGTTCNGFAWSAMDVLNSEVTTAVWVARCSATDASLAFCLSLIAPISVATRFYRVI